MPTSLSLVMKPDPVDLRHRLLLLLTSFCLGVIIFGAFFIWLDQRQVPQIIISSPADPEIVVDVRGAVEAPGLVSLPPGSRMIDVIEASGGFTASADVNLVNLSAYVRDAQMVVIPTVVPDDAQRSAELINLNTATVEELKQLPGIGEVYATRIVAYRLNVGPFQSVDDLANVEGLPPSVIEDIRPLVTVGGGG